MAQREQDILRVDARDKVTGRTKYAADLVFDGILYTKSVHADLPHGKLLAVLAAPILSEGDLLGSVLMIGQDPLPPTGETEYKLVQTISAFLGRHMES